MTTTVCETLGPTAIPDDGRLELIATLPAGELYSVALRWTHEFNGDLAFSLRAPGDSFATLFSALGGASAGGDLTLRDGFPALTSADLVASAAGPFGRADGASTLLGFAFPQTSLAGNWTLAVNDASVGDTGTLDAATLCVLVDASPPPQLPPPPSPPPAHPPPPPKNELR